MSSILVRSTRAELGEQSEQLLGLVGVQVHAQARAASGHDERAAERLHRARDRLAVELARRRAALPSRSGRRGRGRRAPRRKGVGCASDRPARRQLAALRSRMKVEIPSRKYTKPCAPASTTPCLASTASCLGVLARASRARTSALESSSPKSWILVACSSSAAAHAFSDRDDRPVDRLRQRLLRRVGAATRRGGELVAW